MYLTYFGVKTKASRKTCHSVQQSSSDLIGLYFKNNFIVTFSSGAAIVNVRFYVFETVQ